ncbi:GNAT family N-acetyltransferase [Actinomadura rudentiformis]|uniref:GNAT family N-acetyltransferase n=2 Tax=Actinomadura rudentiformis TaxID=359158 RepID=A0A6H9Z066_9ACTN|nr:GNAT family N-acetyltransferase [Actinomadura rudentiformis]
MGFMKQLDVSSVACVDVPATVHDVRIRPYGIGDAEALRQMSERLSSESLYTRFFSGTPQIPEAYVRALQQLDHWDREAMVALLDGRMLGVAEYVRDRREPWRAEIAVLITDPWQGHGLAGRMVRFLAQLAERRGISEFDADVVLANRTAMSAIRTGWPAIKPTRDGGSVHYRLPLPLAQAIPG